MTLLCIIHSWAICDCDKMCFFVFFFTISPDGVAGAQANPLRDGPVLALLLGQDLLDLEGLVGRLLEKRQKKRTCKN